MTRDDENRCIAENRNFMRCQHTGTGDPCFCLKHRKSPPEYVINEKGTPTKISQYLYDRGLLTGEAEAQPIEKIFEPDQAAMDVGGRTFRKLQYERVGEVTRLNIETDHQPKRRGIGNCKQRIKR